LHITSIAAAASQQRQRRKSRRFHSLPATERFSSENVDFSTKHSGLDDCIRVSAAAYCLAL